METRKERGQQIVDAGGLVLKGKKLWLVPSQSHKGKWMVDFSNGEPTCTCPDFEKNSAFCKHIFAILIYKGRLMSKDADPKPEKKKYTQDWPKYNLAQVNERDHFVVLLHALCDGIAMPSQEGRMGRPKTPLADVVFALCLKVYEGTSGRRAASEMRRAVEIGLLSKPVSYNSISDYMSDENLTPLLRTLLQESASPMVGVERTFAVDSTGFGTTTYDRWFDHKWGKERSKAKFVKAHAICGVKTHIVPDLIIDPGGDAVFFAPLVDTTGKSFDIDAICADKAYSSRANLAAAVAVGGVAYIPFKDGTRGGKQDLWGKMYHYYQFKREEFDGHYHARSNVETLFAMVKAKFGASVRSKSERGQINEVYCKYLCHNIVVLVSSIYELGLVPEFWQAPAESQFDDVAVKRSA